MARRRAPTMTTLALMAFAVSAAALAAAKECTNIPTQLSSHTVRARMQASPAPAAEWRWRENSHHDHFNPTDESAWMDLMPLTPPSSSSEFDWAMLYRSLKGAATVAGDEEDGGGGGEFQFLEEVSLHEVRLDEEGDGMYGRAQRTNREYLVMLEVDRLVWSFRTEAGLPAPGKPYGGWEAPDVELRGHFVGHYMSAAAKMWASTHNGTLAGKMAAVVDALHECQAAAGTGYLSAFPAELFDRFEAIQPVWAPYYTIHKAGNHLHLCLMAMRLTCSCKCLIRNSPLQIMQGLLDQYTVAGNGKALGMVVAMADYFAGRVRSVIQRYTIERHWTSLNEETGGMNDVLYQLYTITKDQRHLVLAHLFDKPCFLGLLAVQADSLSGFHANTHIPVVVGGQMRYEVTGDPLYKEIATFFMDVVNSSHTYATGGTSVSEFWRDPKHLAESLTTETEESCATYNMLKVSRHLFRWTKEIAYADYYERALINGVLSIQRGRDPGVMIYMLPQGPGRSKAVSYHGWGTQYNSFWCCYGTGIESFSKLGDSIYFEEKGAKPGLYIIQYIPSTFNWRTTGLTVTQQVKPLSSSDQYLQVSLSISAAQTNGQYATLNVRIPSWTSVNGAKATLNDKDLQLASPGTFLTVSKQWDSGDHLLLQFPINLSTEAVKDDRPQVASLKAILFGPFLLAGLTTGDWDARTGGATAAPSDWITPVPSSHNSQLVTLTQQSAGGKTMLLSTVNDTSLAMLERPEATGGTDAAIRATFRVVPPSQQQLLRRGANGTGVGAGITATAATIEPFGLPGTAISNGLAVVRAAAPGGKGTTLFNVVPGLDGKAGTVSLELGSKPGCFVIAGNAGGKVQVGCRKSGGGGAAAGFEKAASFVQSEPLRRYHPISFFAGGVRRSFLLEPLFTLRDEFYTIYFNLAA
uniref:Alpha-L-arabinofuranosidase B arabinose-binding domain-containing protein n=1 Tax=Leersia perrieri TaxID=77586 RepID=A0A0D9WS38_9ORYZ